MEHKPTPFATGRPDSLPAAHRQVDSSVLLQGRNAVEIAHGDQRYLLRVTRENKLILTK